MADLRGRQIRESYRFLVGLSARTTAASVFGTGMQSTPRFLTDGDGVRSALRIGTASISVNGNIFVSGSIDVQNSITTSALTVTGPSTFAGTVNFTDVSAGGSVIANRIYGNFADTAGTPSFSWFGDIDTGLFSPESDSVGFSTGGIETLRISNNAVIHYGTNPKLTLIDTDAPATHYRTDIYRENNQFGIRTVNSTGTTQSNDYFITLVASGASQHEFRIRQSQAAVIDAAGTAIPNSRTIITREKGDARYTLVDGVGNFNSVAIGLVSDRHLLSDGNQNGTRGLAIAVSGVLAGIVHPVGTAAPATTTIITREKGDARYAQLSASNTFSSGITIVGAAQNQVTLITSANSWKISRGAGVSGEQLQFAKDTVARYQMEENGSLTSNISIVNKLNGDARYAQLNQSVSFTSVSIGNISNKHIFFDGVQNLVRGIAIGVSGVLAAMIQPAGTTSPSTTTVITREKGDARYALTSGKTTNDFNVNRLFVQNNGSAGAPAIRFTGASGTVGINVSANGKNLSFSVNGATSGIIDEPGTAAVNTVTVITREKGDARYLRESSLVYNGTSADQITYPVGTTLMWGDPGDKNGITFNRNVQVTLRLGAAGKFSIIGTGAILTGVWRCRGFTSFSGDHGVLVQRTA